MEERRLGGERGLLLSWFPCSMLISFKSATPLKANISESRGGGKRQYCVFQREADWTPRLKRHRLARASALKDVAEELTDLTHSL